MTTIHLPRPLLLAVLTPSGGGPSLSFVFFQIVLIFGIIYLLVLRPQRRQQQEHQTLLASLQRGDQVVTSSGIVGEVVHIKEDQITVRSGEAKFVVLRTAISSITNRTATEVKPA